MYLWKIVIASIFVFSLVSCQTSTHIVPANVIIENAHGGGSVVKFNNNETILASAGWSGYIRLWNSNNGTKRFSWKAHKGEVTGLYFTDSDQLIISSGYDGLIKIWTTSGKLVKQSDSLHSIRSMVIDEQSNLIVTGHNDGVVRTWALTTLKPLKQRKQHNSAIRAVAYSSHNHMIASSGTWGQVILWPESEPSIKLPSPITDIRTLTFTQNGKTLLGGGWFKLYRWTLKDRKMQALDTEHRGIIRNMQLFDNDATLATISRQTDSAVLLLDPQTGAVKQRFQSHDLCGVDVTVSKNQNFLATTSDDASVRIWRLENKKPGSQKLHKAN